MSNNKVMDQIKKILDNHLELKKQRKTPERYAILEEIYNFNHHFDADELYNKMKKSKFSVSRATIYNTLDLLVELDLVTKHIFKNNTFKYEKSFGYRQHDHLILDSDEILEICDPRIQLIKNSIEKIYDVEIESHSLYFFGKKKKKLK